MAWRRPGDKPLSEAMMVRLPTQICVTRPQHLETHGHKISIVVTDALVLTHQGISIHSVDENHCSIEPVP